MKYKQIHVVWRMNLDTGSRCIFKTYPLENSSKYMSQKQDAKIKLKLNYYPQNCTWRRLL